MARIVPITPTLATALIAAMTLAAGNPTPSHAADPPADQRIKALETQIESLRKQLDHVHEQLRSDQAHHQDQQQQLDALAQDVNTNRDDTTPAPLEKFHVGGYGDIHANFTDEPGGDLLDFHRLVLYLGYDFADWIQFHSEWELEHAFVSDGSGGEFLIEQAYFDFLLAQPFNIRAGRILTPIGIINQRHEPTLFRGVERPDFAKSLIPSTWSSDGIGAFGSITENLTYEAYIVGSLDGSKFTEKDGLRSGRIKERPSLNDPAFTGRLDWRPLLEHDLRLGFSGYYGGVDNGNNGNNPGLDGDVSILSADADYSIGRFDLRGVIAHIDVDNARELGKPGQDIAEGMFGWYTELGYHFLPDNWKTGKLADADAIAFVRYEQFDTQHNMPSGVSANPAADRSQVTLGVDFFPVSNLVLKADYQILDSDADTINKFNLGIGYNF